MSRKVRIETNLLVCSDGTEEHLRRTFAGEWRTQGGRHLLSHSEAENHGRTHILCDDDFVEIRRAGVFSSRMNFVRGAATQTKYDTPHGQLSLTVSTEEVSSQHTETGGRLRIAYALQMNGCHVSDNVLEIEWNLSDE